MGLGPAVALAGGAGCAGAAATTATGLGGAGDLAATGGGGGGGDAGWLLRPPLFRTAATATVITRPPPPAAAAAPAALALLGVPGADRASPAAACFGDLGVAALPAAALPAALPPLPPAAGCCWSSRRDASCAILHSSNGREGFSIRQMRQPWQELSRQRWKVAAWGVPRLRNQPQHPDLCSSMRAQGKPQGMGRCWEKHAWPAAAI